MTEPPAPPTVSSGGPPGSLDRRLGLPGAVSIGLGSMIGAGVFAAFAPAAAAAGGLLLLGLALAVIVALCNATSTAQLAAAYPTSGGAYVYGRERLGEWAGFTAGWAFVIGKTASAAAMATTFAVYAVPPEWSRPVAAVAVVALTAVNLRGITRTARGAAAIAGLVLTLLAVVLAAAWFGGGVDPGAALGTWDSPGGAYGVLQSAGLLFFALAGYARIATLGEEVIDPRRTIPRAIVTTLAAVVVLYAVVALTLLATLGPAGLAASSAPLVDAAQSAGLGPWAGVAARVAAAAACLGALLAGLAGVSRTALAMARHRDLPAALEAVHPVHKVPHRVEMVIGGLVAVAVLLVDLREMIGFSSTGVLVYYAVANLAALTQRGADRRYPPALQVLGLVGCVVLVATLPWTSLAAGLAVLAVGLVGRAVVVSRRRT
ncbi:APC family permease [Georgenia sp. Z1491]|uniref:APC family permease n=1 Tax=Georgenia sp. Z1491 TaxID=3416707 RepID=UPI003CF789FE